MELIINTDKLCELGIDANEYLLLYNLFTGINSCNSYNITTINNLERLGFIKQMPDDTIILRQSALDLFTLRDLEKSFLEFFNSFPMKVGNGAGSRPLRPKSSEAMSVKDTRKKYINIINKNPDLHEHILKVLNAQIDMLKKTNSLQYMNNIDTWLNQRVWEKYEYLLDEDNSSEERVTAI